METSISIPIEEYSQRVDRLLELRTQKFHGCPYSIQESSREYPINKETRHVINGFNDLLLN